MKKRIRAFFASILKSLLDEFEQEFTMRIVVYDVDTDKRIDTLEMKVVPAKNSLIHLNLDNSPDYSHTFKVYETEYYPAGGVVKLVGRLKAIPPNSVNML